MTENSHITRAGNVSERITVRNGGYVKVERISFGNTGRNIHGEPAQGHWKLYGYRKDGKFSRTLAGLKSKLTTKS